jgi:hypothetical protein
MSAPKLGEYLQAGARRRETILTDQKFTPRFKQVFYKEATVAIRRAIVRGQNVESELLEEARRLDAAPATSEYEARAHRGCASAVRRFAKLWPTLKLDTASASILASGGVKLSIEGVTVSVMPLVALERVSAKKVQQSGAMLLVFNQTTDLQLQPSSAKALAELLRSAMVAAGFANVRPELCVVIDVFAGTVATAPTGGQRIANEIASACREISMRWPALRRSRAA